jgi:hypothetical protein
VGTIVNRGKSIRAVVRMSGHTMTKTFADRVDAKKWISEMECAILSGHSLKSDADWRRLVDRVRVLEVDKFELEHKLQSILKQRDEAVAQLTATLFRGDRFPSDPKARQVWASWLHLPEDVRDALVCVATRVANSNSPPQCALENGHGRNDVGQSVGADFA